MINETTKVNGINGEIISENEEEGEEEEEEEEVVGEQIGNGERYGFLFLNRLSINQKPFQTTLFFVSSSSECTQKLSL